MNGQIKQFFDFTHWVFGIIEKDKKSYYLFSQDESENLLCPEHISVNIQYPLNDGVANIAIDSELPVIFDLDDLSKTIGIPRSIEKFYESGEKEILVSIFKVNQDLTAILIFFSDKKECFQQRDPAINQRIMNLIAVGISNVFSNEELQKKELEKEMLLTLSHEMARIRNKSDLLTIINTRLKTLFYFTHSSIVLLSKDRETFSVYLTDFASRSKDHPNYNNVIKTNYPVNDGYFNTILETTEPTVFEIEKLAASNQLFEYGKVHRDAGLKEWICINLLQENVIFGVLTFYSDVRESFKPNQFSMIKGMSSQIAVAVANILANEEIERRENETYHLLSLNHLMARIKDRNDLLEIINGQVRKVIYFTYSTTMTLSEDKQTFSMFLLDPGSQAGNHPDYRNTVTNSNPVRDKVFDVALESDIPVLFDVETLISKGPGHYPTYIRMYYESGIKEVVGISLRNEKEKFGVLALYSDKKNTFTANTLNIIQGIGSLISIGASNIIANEEIGQRALEKETLLHLGDEMARIRDKKDLFEIITTKLNKLFYFVHSSISRLDEGQNNFYDYMTGEGSGLGDINNSCISAKVMYPVNDGIFEQYLVTNEPTVFQYEKFILHVDIPEYIVSYFNSGIRETVSISLRNEQKVWGILHFHSDRLNSYTPTNLTLINGVASQINTAIINIEANEKIQLREQEKEALLAISQQMAKIRDKNELLTLINTQLRKLFYFTHSSISAINDDRKTFYIFLTDPNSKSKEHTKYVELVTSNYPIEDGVFDGFISSEEPTISDYEVVVSNNPPKYARIQYEAGLREAVSIPLPGEKEVWGVLHFYSDRKNTFTHNNVNIIKGVANQVAIAVSNILANEEIKRRDAEKSILLELSQDIASVRDKEGWLKLVNTKLKKLIRFSHSTIGVISGDRQTYSGYLMDPETPSRFHPDFKKGVLEKNPVNDLVFNKAIVSSEPVVFNIAELQKIQQLPVYMQINYEYGFNGMIMMGLRDNQGVANACLALFSENPESFDRYALGIIKGISAQLYIALSNILANEEIQKRQLEKENLLAISNEIGKIRDKNELLTFINSRLKTLFPFLYSSISSISDDGKTFTQYLVDPKSSSRTHPEYVELITTNYPVGDGIFETILKTDEPTIHRHCDLLVYGEVPKYVKIHYEAGFRETVSVPMYGERKVWGVLHFYSDTINTFANYVSIIKGVASQVAIAVSNIIANQEIRSREEEKAVLLSISHQMAKIRDKQELLQLINIEVKKLFNFTHSSISELVGDKKYFRIYLTDSKTKSRKHPDFDRMMNSTFPVADGFFEAFLLSDEPIVLKYQNIIDTGNAPLYARIHYEVGLKEIISVVLYGENDIWGVLHFYSDQSNSFSADKLNLIRGISSQVAIAISNIVANEDIRKRDQEKQTLLSISYEIGKVRDKNELLTFINSKLKTLFYFTHSSISAINEDRETFTVFLTDPGSKSKDHPEFIKMITTRYPIHDGLFEHYLSTEEPTISDIEETSSRKGAPRYTQIHYEAGLREAVSIPMHGEKELFGILTFYSDKKESFVQDNLNIIKGVASQVAVAVSNILAHEEVQRREQEKSSLLSFSNAIATARDRDGLEAIINSYFSDLFNIRNFNISIKNDDNLSHSFYIFDQTGPYTKLEGFEKIKATRYPIAGGLSEIVLNSKTPVLFNADELLKQEKISFLHAQFWKSVGLEIFLGIPLRVADENIGVLWAMANQINDHLLQGISAQIAISIANILANEKIETQFEEINKYKQQLEQENLYLQQEIETTYNYAEIVGSGAEMQKVYRLLSQVAFANSTVLILGETGTGKELIARAIHSTSPRKDKVMIKVNCAALPANLIESELFGHEKGSFTGAIERRIGKFELANQSTLFLDEIGEMPLELQVKLLRALQEKEIERVGGKTPIKVNVRIIAATNRDLQKEIAEGRFRSDLYYRLNVFPITLPSLRDRKEDLPMLTSHFIGRYARNTGKKITGLSAKAMKEIMAYHWPGNIRELEHLIERSILMAEGSTIKEIHLPVINREISNEDSDFSVSQSIADVEREHIMKVLQLCNFKIQGIGSAAEFLNIPATTLHSKMKKLGIVKMHKIKD
ncbi:sigma 54-interacting transcriptional regulator [Dyadobacter frigoris]|uniref:sigma 54-interacting transcriptional regulator n=1 Tax=Dyadobacter frigoris TaxID=2576211 RepID=UPI002555E118|nr:sigma 54-interacting transcriptional regulator [Dyadobacter frigoris]